MIIIEGEPVEFDFFMDEDTRSKRIGVLLMEKRLAPALNQALFRVRQNADIFHKNRVNSKAYSSAMNRRDEISDLTKQMREIKWSSLNMIRSFIAKEFVKQFCQYWAKGPLPIMFFNAPFIDDHKTSINNFFDQINKLNLKIFESLKNSQSIFFLDSFNTPAGFKFEKEIMRRNNLSRCYRLDSRVHDLLQLSDLLLGLTVFDLKHKKTAAKPKLSLYREFKRSTEFYAGKRKNQAWDPIYFL